MVSMLLMSALAQGAEVTLIPMATGTQASPCFPRKRLDGLKTAMSTVYTESIILSRDRRT